jgi:hypothetical protein
MKLFLIFFPLFTFALTANAKTFGCDIGVYRISEKSSERSFDWSFNESSGYSNANLNLNGTPIRVITEFKSLPQGQVDTNLIKLSVYLESTDRPEGYLISLREFYYRQAYPLNKNDYGSLNHPSAGSLALTPKFIAAIKKLGKWGERPFDAISTDNSFAAPDLNVSNSVDFDYFQSYGGLAIADEAFSQGLIDTQDPLFIWVGNTCSIN